MQMTNEGGPARIVGILRWRAFLRGDFGPSIAYLAVALCTIELIATVTFDRRILAGILFDSDCYMHLLRAVRLMTVGGAGYLFEPRINAPFGYAIHWTALFDWLIVAGAAPLHWLGMSLRDSVYAWGSLLSPLSLFFAMVCLAIGTRPWIKGPGLLLLLILVFFQPQLLSIVVAGRIDHHGLVIALLLGQIAWLYALFDGRAKARWAIAAGLMLGMQMCISVEALLTLLAVCVSLGLSWIVWRRDTLKPMALYLWVATITVGLWLVQQDGAEFLNAVAYIHVSIVHLAVLALGAAGVSTAALVPRSARLTQNRAGRCSVLLLAALVPALIIVALYPDFFYGPFPHPLPVMLEWHSRISELQPLFPKSIGGLARLSANMGSMFLAVPFEIYLLRKGTPGEKGAMLATLVAQTIFFVLALFQLRWSYEVQALTLVPLTLLLLRFATGDFVLKIGQRVIPLRVLAIFAIVVAPIELSILLSVLSRAVEPAKQANAANSDPACDWTRAIKALPNVTTANQILLTDLWRGPEILWRTQLRVVGGSYEMPPAIADSITFSDKDEKAVREVVLNRQIDLIMVCNTSGDGPFVTALRGEKYPAWLAPVALPAGLTAFHLYRVVPAS